MSLMAERGPKPQIGQSVSFQITIPKHHHDYLEHLVRMSRLGTKVNEAAVHILVRELDKMFQADYHKKHFGQD
ncbi:MAG TPA: hypothetical protein DCG48_05675 [Rhodospirillaceae bacterium]|nr:hypothetical protein [Rhodospirillaceae bacterium]